MIYADYNATAPLLPAVYEAMLPFYQDNFANPSSILYPQGRRAAQAVEEAREQVAQLVGADPARVVFVSGGTESCAAALIGAALGGLSRKAIVVSRAEHSAVLAAANLLAQPPFDFALSQVALTASGGLDLKHLEELVSTGVGLASVMLANNETGVVWPIAYVSELCRRCGIILHTDAVQAVGKIPVDFQSIGANLLSFSAHKLGGPKGIGVLVLDEDVRWKPVMSGGGQEFGRRGGTLPTPLIVGFGKAAELARQRLAVNRADENGLREMLERELKGALVGVRIFGEGEQRLPNTSSICFGDIVAQELIEELGAQEVMIAAGSACHTSSLEPSHVLLAMGATTVEALSTVRVSLGVGSSKAEVEQLIGLITKGVLRLREQGQRLVGERLSMRGKSL